MRACAVRSIEVMKWLTFVCTVVPRTCGSFLLGYDHTYCFSSFSHSVPKHGRKRGRFYYGLYPRCIVLLLLSITGVWVSTLMTEASRRYGKRVLVLWCVVYTVDWVCTHPLVGLKAYETMLAKIWEQLLWVDVSWGDRSTMFFCGGIVIFFCWEETRKRVWLLFWLWWPASVDVYLCPS